MPLSLWNKHSNILSAACFGVGTLIIASLCLLSTKLLISSPSSSSSKKDSERTRTTTTTSPKQKKVNETTEDVSLSQSFEDAVNKSSSLTNLKNGDQLILYGLFKQATFGDCNIDQPSRMNIVSFTKYQSWIKFKGTPKETAMKQYVEAITYFDAESRERGDDDENADIVYDDDDDIDDGVGQEIGFGLRPSTMNHDDVDYDDKDVFGGEDSSSSSSYQGARKAVLEGDDVVLHEALVQYTNSSSSSNDKVDLMKEWDKIDPTGQTLLHFASDRGHLRCVEELLKFGSNANACDNDGISVLQVAVISGSVDVVRLLLRWGADPDHEDVDGDTPKGCALEDGTEEMKSLFGK